MLIPYSVDGMRLTTTKEVVDDNVSSTTKVFSGIGQSLHVDRACYQTVRLPQVRRMPMSADYQSNPVIASESIGELRRFVTRELESPVEKSGAVGSQP